MVVARLGLLRQTAAGAGQLSHQVGYATHSSEEGQSGNQTGYDPAYKFRYATADAEREEEGDGRGRVRGHYSYTSPGGSPIRVVYSAAPETGFVIENAPGINRIIVYRKCGKSHF